MAVRKPRGLCSRIDSLQVLAARRSHAVFADISWRPYDLRFTDLLGNLKYHSDLVKTEVQFATYHELKELHQSTREELKDIADSQQKISLLQLKAEEARITAETMLQALKRLEDTKISRQWNETSHRGNHKLHITTRSTKRQLDNTVNQLKDWLKPPKFATERERAFKLREEGTANWLFSEPKFVAWRDCVASSGPGSDGGQRDNILWIQGMSSGKKAIYFCLRVLA